MNLDSVATFFDAVGLLAAGGAVAIAFRCRHRIPPTVGRGALLLLFTVFLFDSVANFVEALDLALLFQVDQVEDSIDVLLTLLWWFFFYSALRSAILDRVKQSEEHFTTLLESLQDVVWSTDTDGSLRFLNPAGERLFGFNIAEVAANPGFWLEMVHPDDRERVRDGNEVLKLQGSVSLEYRIVRADGSVRWISDRKSLVADEQGRMVRMGGMATDITDRKLAEEALRVSEENLAQAERRAGLGSWTIDKDNSSTWWSDELYRLHGIQPQSRPPSPEQHLRRLVHPDDRDVLEAFERRVFETHDAGSVEFRTSPVMGPVRWLNLRLTPSDDDHGRFQGMAGTLLDVTDRVEAEQAIRDSEERYRQLVENSPLCIHELDADGRLLSMNAAGLAMMGRSEAFDVSGIAYLDAVCEQDRPRIAGLLEEAIQGQSSQFEFATPNGAFYESCFVPLPNHGETRRQIMGITQDVTKRMEAENRLRASETRFRTLVENSYDVINMFAPTGELTYTSPSVKRVLGFEPEEMMQLPPSEVVHPDDFEEASEWFMRAMQEPGHVGHASHRLRHKDGSYRWVDVTGMNMLDEPGINAMVSIFRDVTEAREASEALRASEARFRTIFEQAAVGVAQIDSVSGSILSVNQRYCEILDTTSEDLVAHTWMELTHADDLASDLEQMERLRAGAIRNFTLEKRLERAGGTFVWINLTVSPMWQPGEEPTTHIAIVEDITERKIALEALAESEQRLNLALEAGRQGAFVWDLKTDKVEWTVGLFLLHGYEPYEVNVTYQEWASRIHPDDLPVVERDVQTARENRGRYAGEYRVNWPDGSTHWIEGRGRFEYDEDGNAVQMMGVVSDIDEKKRSEAELLLRDHAFASSVNGIVIADATQPDMPIIYCNPAFERMTGYSREEALGRNCRFLQGNDCDQPGRRAIRKAVGDGHEVRATLRNYRKDGSMFWNEVHISPVRDASGQVTQFLAFQHDVTEQKAAEAERSRLLDILQRIRNEVYVFDAATFRFEYVNAGALANLGYTLEEMQRRTPLDIKPDFTVERFSELVEPLRSGQSSLVRFETVHQRSDGSLYPVEVHLQLVQRETGAVFLAVIIDITERRRQEQQFRTIVETTQEWVWEIDLAGTHTYSNPAIEDILGYTADEVVGGNALELMHEEDRRTVAKALPALLRGKQGWTGWVLRWKHKDGSVRYLESNASPILDANDGLEGFRGADRDVTERIRADRLLRISEERYRVLTENATEAVVVVDVDSGRFVDFNRKACDLYKASASRLRELGPADLSPSLQPDGSPSMTVAMQHIMEAVNGAEPVFEWIHKDDTGNLIPCEIRLLRLPDDEKRLVRGAVTDITARKQAETERESFIEQLEQKNAELERFTYTVSHDLKSPLITIKGFIGLLAQDLKNEREENITEDIAEIESAADKMHRLLNELLELSRIGRIANPNEDVNLKGIADEAIGMLDSEIKAAGARVVFDEELPTVMGDRVRLVEVLLNLIQNAVRFSSSEEHPEIHIGARDENGETVLYVADNGIGIDPRYTERVFNLFEQLTPGDEGTGIGLSLVKRIVEVHGGWIRLDSPGQGQGCTVNFTLESRTQ